MGLCLGKVLLVSLLKFSRDVALGPRFGEGNVVFSSGGGSCGSRSGYILLFLAPSGLATCAPSGVGGGTVGCTAFLTALFGVFIRRKGLVVDIRVLNMTMLLVLLFIGGRVLLIILLLLGSCLG